MHAHAVRLPRLIPHQCVEVTSVKHQHPALRETKYNLGGNTMKRLFAGLATLALLSMISLLPPAQAQTATAAANSKQPFTYHVSDEIPLRGTVSSVLTKRAPGMIMGSHLLLNTSSGSVDASLGTFAIRGRDGLQVKAGQEVELTGIMKTLNSKPVFLTRLVKLDNQIYKVRN